MAKEENQPPEGKFAEVIRKGREKRAGMEQQARERTDANDVDQAFKILKESEN